MTYKAIKEIGGYGIGEEVPDGKAKIWLDMYLVPHVELVDGKSSDKVKVPIKENNEDPINETDEDPINETDEDPINETEDEMEEEEPNSMLDDYLARNENVVKKNVKSDKLSANQLEDLLDLEKNNKNRSSVIKVIENKLKEAD